MFYKRRDAVITVSHPLAELVVEAASWFIRRGSSFWPYHRIKHGRRPGKTFFLVRFIQIKQKDKQTINTTGQLWCDCQNGGWVQTSWRPQRAAGHKWNNPGFSPPLHQSGPVQKHLKGFTSVASNCLHGFLRLKSKAETNHRTVCHFYFLISAAPTARYEGPCRL